MIRATIVCVRAECISGLWLVRSVGELERKDLGLVNGRDGDFRTLHPCLLPLLLILFYGKGTLWLQTGKRKNSCFEKNEFTCYLIYLGSLFHFPNHST